MKTDLSHYRATALVAVNQLDLTVGATLSKVAKTLKLSRYLAKKLVTELWQEQLIGVSARGLFVTDKGNKSLTTDDKVKAVYHLQLINGIKRDE